MSILTSTGAGLASKFYINNIHQRLMYYGKRIGVDVEFGMLQEKDSSFEFKFQPVIEKKKTFAWIKRSSQYLGEEFSFNITLSRDRAIQIYTECEKENKDFAETLCKRMKDIIHDNIQKRYDILITETSDEIVAFEMVSPNWGTTDSYPETKSANDYV